MWKELHVPGMLLALTCLLSGCQPRSIPSLATSKVPASQVAQKIVPTSTSVSTPVFSPTPITSEVRKTDGMTMIYIPEGEFSMGSDEGEANERPVHKVQLNAYWMDQTEITNGKYALCIDAGKCQAPIEEDSYTRSVYFGSTQFADYPVIFVNWSMAQDYCRWAGVRLPTEAEWEKAARGINSLIYPWGNKWDVDLIKRLNFADKSNPEAALEITVDDGYRDTAPVGSFPAGRSPYGLYHMAGNVWEWVADWFDPTYYEHSPQRNPIGPVDLKPGSQEQRVLRGGSWVASQAVFRTSNRNGLEPDRFSSSIGFRCAR